jgi:hypothetical protein
VRELRREHPADGAGAGASAEDLISLPGRSRAGQMIQRVGKPFAVILREATKGYNGLSGRGLTTGPEKV